MKLDYSLFPTMRRGFLITPMPNKRLAAYDELFQRFCASIYMASNISGNHSGWILDNNSRLKSYTRAALTEFVGIEDYIKNNCKNIDHNACAIYKQENPLFHIMKILRNYNVHIGESSVSRRVIDVSINENQDSIHSIDIYYIDNLSSARIKELHCAKDYTLNDIEIMVSLFDCEQRKFGVSDMLIMGNLLYSDLVSSALV